MGSIWWNKTFLPKRGPKTLIFAVMVPDQLTSEWAGTHNFRGIANFHKGNNFKKCPELTSQNAQNQFQQSFNIVDMSNIHGKHVHSVKTWWNLIRGIVFLAQTASVPDVFEIIALMQLSNGPMGLVTAIWSHQCMHWVMRIVGKPLFCWNKNCFCFYRSS